MLVFTGIFFIACGEEDYSKVSLTCDVSSITLDVGETKSVTFSIQNYFNGMSAELNISTLNSSNIIQCQPSSPQPDGSTTVSITALHGGTTSLRAVTVDGLKECTITVIVNQYSESLTNSDDKLYVSNTTTLRPDSSDFIFDEGASERSLDFFFYGTTSLDDRELTLDDVIVNGMRKNEFVSVSLWADQSNKNTYLIFKDKSGRLFTPEYKEPSLIKNVNYNFISVSIDAEGGYSFAGDALQVHLGDKFTFIAKYRNSNNIFVQRDFYVLTDIASEPITFKYSYARNNEIYDEYVEGDKIILIPNKEDPNLTDFHVDYKTVRLQVTLPSNSSLIGFDEDFDQDNIATKVLLSTRKTEQSTILTYQISSKTSTKRTTNLNLRYYYQGWQDEQDESVNFTKVIPIVVEFEPTAIAVNGEKGSESGKKYTFYNNYASSSYGWQQFDVVVTPADSTYSNLDIEFDSSQVMLRYNGKTYTDGTLSLTDFSQPLYIKGVNDENNMVESGAVRLTLHYDLIDEATLTYDINYQIIAGAKAITFAEEIYHSDGVYLALNNEEVLFKGLYADASFNTVTMSLFSGDDVVELVGTSIESNGKRASIGLKLKPKALGSGTYTVMLDNGTAVDVNFKVIETLDSLKIVYGNENSAIVQSENVYDEYNNLTETKIYIKNGHDFNKVSNVRLIANNNEFSEAISGVTLTDTREGFSYTYSTSSYVDVTITTLENGSGAINFIAYGLSAVDFKLKQTEKHFTLTVVSYSLIDKVNVYKTHDGKGDYSGGMSASYSYVYIGAENEKAQSATFDVSPLSEGYGFFNPGAHDDSTRFLNQTFDKRFVYWTVSGASIAEGRNIMYYLPNGNNVYTILDCGTFNTETMTFTSFADAGSNFNINLIANIRQIDKVYSYTVSITALSYNMIGNISTQESLKELHFSANPSDIEQQLIVRVSALDEKKPATNPEIKAIFEPRELSLKGEDGELINIPVNIFGDVVDGQYEGITQRNEVDQTFLINLNCEKFAGSELSKLDEKLEGRLIIAPTDWLDASGNVAKIYQNRVISISIKYENGTLENPYYLEDKEDVLNMKNALNAHYRIVTSIDMHGTSAELPLGNFSGTLIGTSDYAKIYGLEITQGKDEAYGLFSAVSGEIKNVKFEGVINVADAVPSAKIGLITAVNEGKLINLGATVTGTSNINLLGGASVGIIAGVNNGEILQDNSLYTTKMPLPELDENGEEIYDENDKLVTYESNILLGLNPNILVYMGQNYLNIKNVSADAVVKVGGVTGENNGSIMKKDASELKLYGYSQYLAYVNINVMLKGDSGNLNQFTDGEDGVNFVGGVAGYSAEGSIISGKGDAGDAVIDYEKAKGIVVGGTVIGPQYVGGVAGNFEGSKFEWITSRTFVRGYTAHTGAITGGIRSGISDISGFVVQAVDDGRLGVEASMVVRYLNNEGYSTTNRNEISFGQNGHVYDVFNDKTNNMFTYLTRKYLLETESIITSTSSNECYGDYVEIASSDSGLLLHSGYKFTPDSEAWSVKANTSFKTFNSSDLFYVNYFEAIGLLYQASQNDLTTAQKALDENLNTISTNSTLYPILATDGLIFTSTNIDLISFNESGVMTVKGTGVVKITISSILNTNDSLAIYIKSVNYFNSDSKASIVYPETSEDAVAVDETTIHLKGNNSVTHYVKPNYSLFVNGDGEFVINDYANLTNQELTKNNLLNIVDKNGLANLDNLKLYIAPNTEIVPDVKLVSYKDVNGNTLNLPEGENAINITINGQTITYSKNLESHDGTYGLDIKTFFKATIGSGREYICEINKNLTSPILIYTKGAESIHVDMYDKLTITTKNAGEDNIIVDSPSDEIEPIYILYRIIRNDKGEQIGVEALQGTADWINNYLYTNSADKLFTVDLDKTNKTITAGEQKFKLNISVNKLSNTYLNRHLNNIYGEYLIEIYAASDTNKMVSIPINLENMYVNNLTIDNYYDISYVETSSDFSTASLRTYPGKTGLLVVNLSPEDADFDYVEIVNTENSNMAGNGKATFNLVAKYANLNGNEMFDENKIAGSSVAGGIKINMQDIVGVYSGASSSGNAYEKYRGIIYLDYLIGTSGVEDGHIAEFRVTVYKDGVVSATKTITLTMNLNYHAYVTLDNKTPLLESEQGVHKAYQVARGLTYKLDLDYYGFAFENIEVSVSDGAFEEGSIASLSYESGSYYLNISPNEIDFTNYTSGYPVSIFVNAAQKEGEIDRTFASITKVYILEYVLNYQYTKGDELKDIVEGMDNGVINVQIGNIQPLKLDLTNIIEYNPSIESVVANVNSFLNTMTMNGAWTAYTNLNDSGISTGRPIVSIDDILEDSDFSQYNITPNTNLPANVYFKTNGLSVIPLVTHKYIQSFYAFSYSGNFRVKENSGIYENGGINDSALYTEFRFNVYQSSSSEHPVPIDNYQDLLEMQDNVHYILTKDITLTNDFKPLEMNIASLDGNGFTIYFKGTYNFENEYLGLFTEINQDTIIKNLTIALSGNTVFKTSSSTFYAGLLAGQNSGNLTNCYVYSMLDEATSQEAVLTVECSELDSASFVAGLVGQNNGNITNSRSSVNITSIFNVAGLVGMNSGNISSSYFKNAQLICKTQSNHNVGGLVVSNAENGNIITSYVSGEPEADRVYTRDDKHFIRSTSKESAFAFSNLGNISDCYTNIRLYGSSEMSGFVHYNGGQIRNCFSTSVLVNLVTSSAGFSMGGSYNDKVGSFANCYYFFNSSTDDWRDQKGLSGYNESYGEINSSLANVAFDGVDRLNYKQFSVDYLSKYFVEYAYISTTTPNAVWFYSTGFQNEQFNNVQFANGRLELVAPNIIAYSNRQLSETIEDDTTGDSTYVYEYTEKSAPLGSLKNPYLLYNAEEMELYLTQPASISGYNNKNYRMIANIDYSEYDALSQTYKLIYYGNFEGNGMTVSNMVLVSTEKLTNAGLFAQIGRDSSTTASVMNLNLQPKEVSFANANCVGALAGTLTYGSLFNVKVITQSDLTVLGSNFVGGVVGRTINNFTIKNVTSSVSAVAYYKSNVDNSYSQNKSDLERYSYAGGLIGFAAGNGLIHKGYAESIANVMASRVGVAIGGFDTGVSVDYIYVSPISSLEIKAYTDGYAGIAFGEVKGKANHIQVKGTGIMDSPFKLVPGLPKSVGGIAGLLSGGTISNSYMGQSFRLANLNIGGETTLNVANVGGIAGIIENGDSSIVNTVVEAKIFAVANTLGGVVGRVRAGLKLDQVAVKSLSLNESLQDNPCLQVSGRMQITYVGGLIGSLENSNANITDCYSLANISVSTFVYTSDITAHVGSFIGSGTPKNMSYCYAIGMISVQLEDKRSVDEVQNVYGDGEGKFEYKTTANKSFENVYYYGSSGIDGKPLATELEDANMISYKAKTTGARYTRFNHNNIGNPSHDMMFALQQSYEAIPEHLPEITALRELYFHPNAIYDIVNYDREFTLGNASYSFAPWCNKSTWTLKPENVRSQKTYLTMENTFDWLI